MLRSGGRGLGLPVGGIFRKRPWWSYYVERPHPVAVASGGGGVITVTHLTKGNGAIATTFTTASVTRAAGTVMVVTVGLVATSNTVVSVSFAGGAQSLTLLALKATGTTTLQNRVEVWELVGGAAETGTIVITTSASAVACWEVASVSGAVAGAGWRDAAVTDGNTATATPSITVASAVGDLAMAAFTNRDSTKTWTTDASPVAEVSAPQTTGSGSSNVRLALLTETGAASTSPSAVLGSSGSWSAVGWNVNVAAASSTNMTGATPNVSVTAPSGTFGVGAKCVTGAAASVAVTAPSSTFGVGALSLTGTTPIVTVVPRAGTFAAAPPQTMTGTVASVAVVPRAGTFGVGALSLTGPAATVTLATYAGTLAEQQPPQSLIGARGIVTLAAPNGTFGVGARSLVATSSVQVSIIVPQGGSLSAGPVSFDIMAMRIAARIRPLLAVSGAIRASG